MGIDVLNASAKPHTHQRRRRVLVISDRYPEDTHGGAEISLHDTLAAVASSDWDIRIIALSTKVEDATQETVSGLPVFRLPTQSLAAPWNAGKNVPIGRLPRLWRYLNQSGAIAPKIQRIVIEALAHNCPEHRPFIPDGDTLLTSDVELNYQIQKVVDDWQPDVVHADNKDSVLLASRLQLGPAKLIAMVRDHRHYCMHPAQAMTVNGLMCETCNFGCMDGVPRPMHTLLSKAMIGDRDLRLAALRDADRVVTTSNFLVACLASWLPEIEVTAIGNPYPDFELKREYMPPDPVPTFLFAGNLREEKGALVFLDALPALKQAVGHVRFVIAGQGPLQDRIAERITREGTGDLIELVGFLNRDDIRSQMQRALAVVGTGSFPEGFGRLPLEAGVLARPSVVARTGGYLETVQHEQTGLLVKPGDPNELAQALIRLAKNRDWALELGHAARDAVLANYAPATIAQRLTEIWNDSSFAAAKGSS